MPTLAESSAAYDERWSWWLHRFFVAGPALAMASLVFLGTVQGASETMARYDVSFAYLLWVGVRAWARYVLPPVLVHGAVTSLWLRNGPWTVNHVLTVHARTLALWALLLGAWLLTR